ncbi:hypothetical protein BDD39_001685 [Saccharococcus thermophilus]|uniref:Uncharacterized protein n=1 Tax=Saccharococcus thermophilus TaxID=29396 RepID=A0A846MIR3_9BACL|nr:hypothetical protein [Saccharococcus thermophilus]
MKRLLDFTSLSKGRMATQESLQEAKRIRMARSPLR